MSVQETLQEAREYMKGKKVGTWAMYEYFKKSVGWIDSGEYQAFVVKLTEILRL